MGLYESVPEYDMEMQTPVQSIESIRVSRKERADGTVVRIKETFLSDGTSYTEEKIVSRPSTSTSTPRIPSTRTPQSRHHRHNNNDRRPFACEFQNRHHQTITDHCIEFLPTSIDKPAPVNILSHYRLPQSKSSWVYAIVFRFTCTLFLLLLSALVAAWVLQCYRPLGYNIQTLFHL